MKKAIADRLHRDMLRAVSREHPVTVTYAKATGEVTVRTIEPFALASSLAGDEFMRAMDRETGEPRSWRLDRVLTYTVHRSRFTVKRPTEKGEW